MYRRFFWIALAVAIIAVAACTVPPAKVRAVVTPCTSYATPSLDTVHPGTTANQVEREDTPKPPPVDQQICDESIALNGATYTCADIVNSYSLPVVGGGPGFSGTAVGVERSEDYLRINWDSVAGHTLIVNGTQFAYLDGLGLDTQGKTVPTATLLYYRDWGDIVQLDVCGWKK